MLNRQSGREKSLLFFSGEFCEYNMEIIYEYKAKQIDKIITTEYNQTDGLIIERRYTDGTQKKRTKKRT